MRQPEQWQVTGSAAENYEQYLVPSIFSPWAADLIDVVAPKQGERLLDVACGTGILARLIAERAADIALHTGVISEREQRGWLETLRAEQAAGRFIAGQSFIFAWGIRPDERRRAS